MTNQEKQFEYHAFVGVLKEIASGLHHIAQAIEKSSSAGGWTLAEEKRIMAALKDLDEAATLKKQIAQVERKGGLIMASIDSVLQQIADTKAKVLALQDAIKAGGMSAADEAKVEAALTDLSQTADPAVPNPPV